MVFSSGLRLGPYEVIALLGAGGMGEVYRAKDTRLSREVALKVLPAELAADSARLKRFEREALAASALNHPNIVTIYDIGSADSISYIAMERVEGETLRELLVSGSLPTKKLLQIATQIADGLAKAHEAGIVHRDLKPANVMVTKDGLVKILDFGLAKLTRPDSGSGEGSRLATETVTSPGVVVGTVSYMSPEQACGHPVDFQSDQFSFGTILYEMATGQRAFQKANTPDTLSAILHEEPRAMAQTAPQAPVPLRWIVERCLAKEPGDRYAATKDLARDLATVRDRLAEASGAVPFVEAPRRRPGWGTIGLAVGGLAALAGMLFLGRGIERAHATQPRFPQLTFRGAGIGTARFAPDGQTIVFSSQTEGRPPQLFSMRLDSPEVRPLGLPPAHVLSIASSGQMAILLPHPFALGPRIGHLGFEQLVHRDPFLLAGTLAEASLSGGAPRELLEDVMFADWAPNGTDLAVVHRAGNRSRLEFPIGKAIYEAETSLLNHPRTSHREARLAFKDWGELFLKDSGSAVRAVPGVWLAYEIAWSDATREIWYTWYLGRETEIHAVTAAGRDRLVARLPGDFVLYDIAPDGRLLLGHLVKSTEMLASSPDEPRERNLSYFNQSVAMDLTANGEDLLFEDVARTEGVGGGDTYVRKTDGSPPRRLGIPADGGLSPDGRFVLSSERDEVDPNFERLVLVPTGPGESRKLELARIHQGATDWRHAGFFPDGKRIFFSGQNPTEGQRVWVQSLDGGKPRPVTPREVRRPVVLGDGRFLCARAADFNWYLYPVESGEPRKVAGILPGEEPIRSPSDRNYIYIRGADALRPGETLMTTRVYRLDPWTGRRELVKEIPPLNPRTGGAISTILLSRDGKTCVWTHMRYSTELVLAEGLK